MKKLNIDKQEKSKVSIIFSKPFNKLNKEEKKEVLKIGAKDFSKRFANVIRELAKT